MTVEQLRERWIFVTIQYDNGTVIQGFALHHQWASLVKHGMDRGQRVYTLTILIEDAGMLVAEVVTFPVDKITVLRHYKRGNYVFEQQAEAFAGLNDPYKGREYGIEGDRDE